MIRQTMAPPPFQPVARNQTTGYTETDTLLRGDKAIHMTMACIFLTPQQALAAVCRDLNQYAPQVPLMSEILRLVSGGRETIIPDPRNHILWRRREGEHRLQRIDPPTLVTVACERLTQSQLSLETWVSICRRVFQTRVQPGTDDVTGQWGLRVFTAMESFDCRQCGQCCRHLDFRHALTAEDVQRWRQAGRDDILAWVGDLKDMDGKTAYQMWVVPGTSRFADGCPFLKQGRSNHLWRCGIHKVKPLVCRQYPITRKHAVMTGCRGFDA
jgi:Fe-S-cluster containining protein